MFLKLATDDQSLARVIILVDPPVVDTVGSVSEYGHIVTLPTAVLVDRTADDTAYQAMVL